MTAANVLKFEKFHITYWEIGNRDCSNLQKCSEIYKDLEPLKGKDCGRLGSIFNTEILDSTGLATHQELNGRVLVTKSDHSLVGFEFDGNFVYPDTSANQDEITFLLAKFSNASKSVFKETLCTRQKRAIYNYEVMYFKKPK